MIIMRYVLLLIIGFILGMMFMRSKIERAMDKIVIRALENNEFMETIGDYEVVRLHSKENGISFGMVVNRKIFNNGKEF